MSSSPANRQARREAVSHRADVRNLIEIITSMDEDELRELRAAINGEAPVVKINPRRAYEEAR